MASDICQQIELARAAHAAHGQAMALDRDLSRLVSDYRARVQATAREMERVGVIEGCTICAQKTGSCCFREIEDCYDQSLLLINLLMGEELPVSREIDGNCFFLGPRGCKLFTRYSFCINYLCVGLKSSLDPASITRLMAVAGEEIYAGWQAETALLKWLAVSSRPEPRP